MSELDEQIMLITGASRGIGAATARLAAQRGAFVIVNYREGEAAAQKVVDDIKGAGGDARILQADVAEPDQVKKMFGTIRKEHGGVDILVNNAGILREAMLTMTAQTDFDQQMAVNTRGTFLCMQRAAKQMVAKKKGRIINIASIVGRVGARGYAAYAASKAAVVGMSMAAAKELGPVGITVNVVSPGIIETDMTTSFDDDARQRLVGDNPVGRLGTVEDVARAVVFLAGPESSYINGQVIGVDGGQVMST